MQLCQWQFAFVNPPLPPAPLDFRKEEEVTLSLGNHFQWVGLVLLLVLFSHVSLGKHMLCQLLGKVHFILELSLMVALK